MVLNQIRTQYTQAPRTPTHVYLDSLSYSDLVDELRESLIRPWPVGEPFMPEQVMGMRILIVKSPLGLFASTQRHIACA